MPKRAPTLRMPLLALERFAGPLHRRVYLALREAIRSGGFGNSGRLPSTRALAKMLGISRHTVLSAYDRLAEEGYTSAKIGSGTRAAVTFVRAPYVPVPRTGAAGGLGLSGILQRAHYPLVRARFCDGDGNGLYLFEARAGGRR
ncbi:MAG TPA: winged helix-turn-helix domain-containing protein [Candidatus Angelobacter sp.]|nr:winged helix-turn-helix domain-containing protein [Candidatus Angelobacter sp.]